MDAALFGIFLVLADVAAIAGLVSGTFRAGFRLRAVRRDGGAGRPLARARVTLTAVTSALALVLAANGWFVYLVSTGNEITPAQAVGTWAGSLGYADATVRIFPDGTFTATRLPPDIDGASSPVRAVAAELRGTWRIGSDYRDGNEPAVVCSPVGGPRFELTFGDPPTPGNPPEAEFTYQQQDPFSVPVIYFLDKQ